LFNQTGPPEDAEKSEIMFLPWALCGKKSGSRQESSRAARIQFQSIAETMSLGVEKIECRLFQVSSSSSRPQSIFYSSSLLV
jgi:hypothetical protein